MSFRYPSVDPVDAKWIARNPAYREPPPVWELRAAYDRARVMRDLAVLTPKPPRPSLAATRSPQLSGCLDLSRLARNLVIDGYDRSLRRWALERCRRGMNALYFSAGLLAAAVIAGIASLCVGRGAVSDAIGVMAGINLGGAVLVLVYALSRILPIVAAWAYGGSWVRHMPRSRAAPRYWRMYEEPYPGAPRPHEETAIPSPSPER
ncbi:MAG: hypothetical protein ACYTEY_10320 [Planctomycetota bacterium]|jgi:hypothetical protein